MFISVSLLALLWYGMAFTFIGWIIVIETDYKYLTKIMVVRCVFCTLCYIVILKPSWNRWQTSLFWEDGRKSDLLFLKFQHRGRIDYLFSSYDFNHLLIFSEIQIHDVCFNLKFYAAYACEFCSNLVESTIEILK